MPLLSLCLAQALSGRQPVVFDATSRAFYDGSFSMQLPTCLPGVLACSCIAGSCWGRVRAPV
jgi:hypothetical protein